MDNLEKNYYDNFPIKQELYDSFRKQLNSFTNDYYYEECNYNISYYPKENRSEKSIVRTMKIRSYKDSTKIKNLYLFSYSLSPCNVNNSESNTIPFQVLSIFINNVNYPIDQVIVTERATANQLLDKCGYSITYTVYLKDEITLSSGSDMIIRIEYKSIVTDLDNSMSFRVPVPCKKYLLNFIAPTGYKVIAHAYGSFDNASNSSNSKFDNSISVYFDNWLMPDNGVTICCIDKNCNKQLERNLDGDLLNV